MQAQRTCRTCGEAKSTDGFYGTPHRGDGLMVECKECWKARSRRNKRARADQREARRARILNILEALDMKVCSRCKVLHLRDKFYVDRARTDGLSPYCRPCQRASVARSVERHGRKNTPGKKRADARAYVHALKAAPCADCGQTWHPKAMHFHHRDPAEKNAAVSALISRGAAAAELDAEIAKCELLCANCHAVRHAEGDTNGA